MVRQGTGIREGITTKPIMQYPACIRTLVLPTRRWELPALILSVRPHLPGHLFCPGKADQTTQASSCPCSVRWTSAGACLVMSCIEYAQTSQNPPTRPCGPMHDRIIPAVLMEGQSLYFACVLQCQTLQHLPSLPLQVRPGLESGPASEAIEPKG